MQLIKCHIENFGKLSDFSINFSSGINIINEPNGWGKSTLAAFLKAMFYGFDAKKDARAFEKERNLYRPWQDGTFGGELDFEVNGKAYRIIRTFGRTEKTDTFQLLDLSTNLEVKDFSCDIGTEIFELDSASFKRSIYIAQNDIATGTSDTINAKLGNLAENTNDINNFENAINRLKNVLNELTPERVTGSIKKRKNYITQLQQELGIVAVARESLESIKAKEQQVVSEIEELLQIRKGYKDDIIVASEEKRKAVLWEQYNALCQDVEAKEQVLQSFEEIFPIRVPEDAEFTEQLQYVNEMTGLIALLKKNKLSDEEKEQYDDLLNMFENGIPMDNEIEEMIAKQSDINKLKEEIAAQEARLHIYEEDLEKEWEPTQEDLSTTYRIPIFMGVGMSLVGVIASALSILNVKIPIEVQPQYLLIGGSIITLLGFIIMILGLMSRRKNKKAKEMRLEVWREKEAELQEKANELSEQIQSMQDDLKKSYDATDAFLKLYKIDCDLEEYEVYLYKLQNQLQDYMRLMELMEETERMYEEYEALHQKIRFFTDDLSLTIDENISIELTEVQKKAVEYRIAKKVLDEAIKKKEKFEKAQDKSFWVKEALCPYTVEELNEMIAQADEKLEDLKGLKAKYYKQFEELQEQLDVWDEKSEELQGQLKIQEEEMQKYKLVKITREYLQKAKEQFTSKYMRPISSAFTKYYEIMTMNQEENWVVDANIDLKVKEQGELRELGWFSVGSQDLLNICMRLALVDAMYRREKPFLILDDPFVNLDNQKVTRANQLLVNVAHEYQIIYFTCHDSRTP